MWKVTTLGDVCKMYQPQTISKKEMKSDGKYFVYGANGIIGKYNKYNHSEPQLLITCRGATCGSVNISLPFSWINGNAMVIQPDTSVVSLKFMEYVFRGGINLSKVITGSAQPQITRESLNPITFVYPPLIEQKRIVAKLDAAFAGIDKVIEFSKTKLDRAEKLKGKIISKYIFNNVATRLKVKLGKILKTGAGGTPLKSKVKYYEGGDIKWLLSGAVCKKNIYDSITFITQQGLENSSARIFPKNTVLVAMYGATAGQVGILRTEAATNQAVCGIYPSKEYLPEYLYYFLTDYKKTLLLEASGVAQPNLSQVKIKNILLPIITVTEQQLVITKIDSLIAEIAKLSEYLDKQLECYKTLKVAILKQELHSKEAA